MGLSKLGREVYVILPLGCEVVLENLVLVELIGNELHSQRWGEWVSLMMLSEWK